MQKRVLQILALFIGFSIGQAIAQEPFYKGKIIKVVVGFSPGGAMTPMPGYSAGIL